MEKREIKRKLKMGFPMRLVNRWQINLIKIQKGGPRWCAVSSASSEEAGQRKSAAAGKEVKNLTT